MNGEPQALERSALEAKGRDELQAIAAAIGAKPGSRARKAEIVEAILDAAGVGGPSVSAGTETRPAAQQAPNPQSSGDNHGPEPEPQGTSEESSPPSSTAESHAATVGQARSGSGRQGLIGEPEESGGSGTQQRPSSGRSAAADSEKTVRGDRDGRSRQQSGERGQGGRSGNQDNQDRNSGGRSRRRDEERNPRDRDRDRNRDQNDQAEPGNRRRRRRGRDRDREEETGATAAPNNAEPVAVTGLLDLRDEGYGFLRQHGYLPSKDDVYVSTKQVRQFSLRKGDLVAGMARPAGGREKNPALLRVDTVNGDDPENAKTRPMFEDLTPLFPDERLKLERLEDPMNMTARIVDLISPIGKGQRGLIVSPPKAGKTTILKQVAQSIEANNPEVHLMVLLVDERPEEVTDMRRSVRGEVIASTFDRPSDEHTAIAELTIERAKRMVEEGKDVVIVLDGITRLARAYNLAAPATGRIMSGGVDSGALYPPKRFFGAARNIEEGGSLTILATALVETGSRMDEVIFEEFKGTGNMELRLDRKLGERRIYPAIDVDASSTRHEELLFERRQLNQVWKLRRVLSGLAGGDGEGRAGAGLELLIDRMKTFGSNDEFLAEIAKASSM